MEPGRFTTTQWSLVAAAADSHDPRARAALAALCEAYWPPVYAFVRSRGVDTESAKDLTQGFFATMLEKRYLKDADRARGRFRSFLLASVKHYLSNARDHERALKRGGGTLALSLDLDTAEQRCRIDPAGRETPERAFEKHWALTLLDRVLDALEREAGRRGSLARFRLLRPLLTDDGDASHRDLARALELRESAVKVAVHRLRRRFGQLLREEVARTVDAPDAVDAEIRHLFEAMRY